MRGTGRAITAGRSKTNLADRCSVGGLAADARRPLLGGAFCARAGWVGMPTRNQCASTSFEWWACWAALAKSLQME